MSVFYKAKLNNNLDDLHSEMLGSKHEQEPSTTETTRLIQLFEVLTFATKWFRM
jgi:hypothetical protein